MLISVATAELVLLVLTLRAAQLETETIMRPLGDQTPFASTAVLFPPDDRHD